MNIYMIICDELRADTLGFMGNDIIQTPNLDDLAEDSIVFENSYCNTPMCVPSRVSIATGRHALSHGALDNMLRPLEDEVSMFTMLKEKGYNTFNHGKWHCNIDPSKFGMCFSDNHVEDTCIPESYVSCFGVSDRETRKHTEYKRNYGDISLIMYGTRPSDKDDTLDSVVTSKYIEDITKCKESDQPVFARLSIMDPHTPYFPAEPYASMYDPEKLPLPESFCENLDSKPVLQRYFNKARGFDLLGEKDYRKSKASYYGLVSHVDERVGKAIDKIKELGEYEDSLIIFTADHGSMMGEHGYIEKWGHMYEEVMRTPLMIKLPNNEHKGKKLDSYVESIDVFPTVLELLNMDIPESIQGKSLMPYITGKTDKHKDEVYGQYYCGALQNESALMVRDKKWKLTSYPEGNIIEGRLLSDDPLKMSGFFDDKDVFGQLYDMENDPEEVNNLFDNPEYEEVKTKYLAKIAQWKEGLGNIVETETMEDKNTLGVYVLKQGENMSAACKLLERENRLKSLKRKR